jgi:hypothetical protein
VGLSSSQALALTVPASRSVMIENGCVIACNPATLFVVTEDGAYVRANFLPTERGYKPCYVRSGVWHDRDRDYPGVCGLTPRAAGTGRCSPRNPSRVESWPILVESKET